MSSEPFAPLALYEIVVTLMVTVEDIHTTMAMLCYYPAPVYICKEVQFGFLESTRKQITVLNHNKKALGSEFVLPSGQ